MNDAVMNSKEIVAKKVEEEMNTYKTIFHKRDLGDSRSFIKDSKLVASVDKQLGDYQCALQEKRVSNIAGPISNSRSSSALKKKRTSNSVVSKKGPLLKYSNLLTPTTELINKLLFKNKDERYRYLIKNAMVHYVEKNTESIYVELPQIPNILIIYRKPEVRIKSIDNLSLEDRGLTHIPLLEGEEKLTCLVLKRNKVSKIENLVSLPNLENIDLSFNVIREITNLNTLEKLRHLNLRNNIIDNIYGLGLLQVLESLDLANNKVKKIERLEKCINLKSLNLSGNFIAVLDGL